MILDIFENTLEDSSLEEIIMILVKKIELSFIVIAILKVSNNLIIILKIKYNKTAKIRQAYLKLIDTEIFLKYYFIFNFQNFNHLN